MPTYQYACRACGEQLEAVQAFSDASLTECPNCTGDLRKVFSAVGVVFKGSGFYKNDSRPSGASSDAASDKKSDKKADTAPAAASTSKTESTSSPAAASTTSSAAPAASSAPAKTA